MRFPRYASGVFDIVLHTKLSMCVVWADQQVCLRLTHMISPNSENRAALIKTGVPGGYGFISFMTRESGMLQS